jgi:hypothetical protein
MLRLLSSACSIEHEAPTFYNIYYVDPNFYQPALPQTIYYPVVLNTKLPQSTSL